MAFWSFGVVKMARPHYILVLLAQYFFTSVASGLRAISSEPLGVYVMCFLLSRGLERTYEAPCNEAPQTLLGYYQGCRTPDDVRAWMLLLNFLGCCSSSQQSHRFAFRSDALSLGFSNHWIGSLKLEF